MREGKKSCNYYNAHPQDSPWLKDETLLCPGQFLGEKNGLEKGFLRHFHA